MVIDIEVREYTLAQAEELLDYLYRYYHDRPRGGGEAGEMVTRLQEQGFAGFTKVLEIILNSDEMTERVRKEFDELWRRYFSHLTRPSTRRQWEGRLRHGRARAREELEKELTRSKAELVRALALIDSHDYLEAQRILEATVTSGTVDWFFYHYLGYALYRQGEYLQSKYLDAMPYYREAIEQSPDDDWPWSCDDLKGCYEHSGLPDRFKRGLEYFKTVIDRYPNRWIAYHECGWMCLKLGDLQEAQGYYRKALELCREPSWGWTANDLRQVFEQQGKLEEALWFYTVLTMDQPYSDNWGAWYALAYAEWKTGNAQGALNSFERSIELYRQYHNKDGNYWTLLDYGWCLKDLERYDEALDRFERAKALDPRQWDGWHGVGWVLKKRQDFAGAKAHFEEALQLNSQSAWSWVELGYVYQYQTMASNPLYPIYAWEAYETALVVGASNESACAAAREAQALLNDKIGVPLQGFIESAYSLKDLEDLCFNLSIDFDNLSGDTKSSKIRHLILYCQRRGETLALIKQLHDRRAKLFPPLVTAPESRR